MGHGSAVLGAGTYVEAEWFCFEEGTMSLLIATEFKVTKGNTARLEMAIMMMIPFASVGNKKSPVLAKNDFFCISLSV